MRSLVSRCRAVRRAPLASETNHGRMSPARRWPRASCGS